MAEQQPTETTTETSPEPKEIEFHYIKSNQFRVIKVDGAFGGVGPRGDIHMAFFNERNPIPLKITHSFTPPSTVGDETGRLSRMGIVREVEVDVSLTATVARSIAKWLNDKADQLEKLESANKVS